jgi:hypothetical protein
MRTSEQQSTVELRQTAAAVVGEIVFAISSLEFNLSLYLRNAVGAADPEAANPLVGRLSFKSKLDALREIVARKFASQPNAINELEHWLTSMDMFRSARNSFVHGRWAFLESTQQIVNVSPGLPNGKSQKETRYSAHELQLQLQTARQLVSEFRDWSDKWPC